MRLSPRLWLAALVLPLLLAACTGDDAGGGARFSRSADGSVTVEAFPEPVLAPEFAADEFDEFVEEVQSAAFATEEPPLEAGATAVQIAERRVISTGSLSLRVQDLQTAVRGVQDIAEGLNGFLQDSFVSASDEAPQANLTIRVPQEQFTTALERLRRLGTAVTEQVGVQDVTAEVVDLEARLRSAQREEESLFSLLDRVTSVADVLAIERELARVRTEVERLEGQLQFLENRVALATISVFLFTRAVPQGDPPAASLDLEVGDVGRAVEAAKALTESLDGVVDRVFLQVDDFGASASLSLRVPRPAFSGALAAFEESGDVRSKQVQEGTGPQDTDPDAEPDARFDLDFTEAENGLAVGVLAAIIAASVIVGLAVLAGLVALAWRRR